MQALQGSGAEEGRRGSGEQAGLIERKAAAAGGVKRLSADWAQGGAAPRTWRGAGSGRGCKEGGATRPLTVECSAHPAWPRLVPCISRLPATTRSRTTLPTPPTAASTPTTLATAPAPLPRPRALKCLVPSLPQRWHPPTNPPALPRQPPQPRSDCCRRLKEPAAPPQLPPQHSPARWGGKKGGLVRLLPLSLRHARPADGLHRGAPLCLAQRAHRRALFFLHPFQTRSVLCLPLHGSQAAGAALAPARCLLPEALRLLLNAVDSCLELKSAQVSRRTLIGSCWPLCIRLPRPCNSVTHASRT